MAKIDAFFNLMFEQRASDLHMASGNPPMMRIHGELQRVDFPPLESDALKAMLYEIAPDYKIKLFEETGDGLRLRNPEHLALPRQFLQPKERRGGGVPANSQPRALVRGL
jgi:hypothetical protein